MDTLNFAFFGTPEFSVTILEELTSKNYLPSLIVTAQDKKVGRKQVLTPSPVKVWAQKHNIEVLQSNNTQEVLERLKENNINLNIVAAYGYILKKDIIDFPEHGTLNVHTSLLPKYRGACPIESALLHGDTTTGSTIMLMDEKMDHGPIVSQETLEIQEDDDQISLFEKLGVHGGHLLAETIEAWVLGDIQEQVQDHTQASYCYKITKADGDVTDDSDEKRYLKYKAYKRWPGIFYFDEGKRVKITEAQYVDEVFEIQKVIPEGKNGMEYQQYLNTKNS